MTDEDLKTYLPSYGDRLAVLGFCRRKEDSPNKTRKVKLFDRLKSKLAKRKPSDGDSGTKHVEHSQPTKKNALRNNRKIEIGWMHYDSELEAFKQVRVKRGGGTRKVQISKNAQKKDLIQEAVHLFFPNGKNSKGLLADFELDLQDYQEAAVDDAVTVGQLYTETKLNILRFYLTTRKKTVDNPHGHSAGSDLSLERQETSQNQSSATSLMVTSAPQSASFQTLSSEIIDLVSATSDSDFPILLYSAEGENADVSESSNIFIGNFSDNEPLNLDDTLPFSPQTMPSNDSVKKILVVHRGQVLPELIRHFCDDGLQETDFKIQLVLPDGTIEKGFDDGGVVRDCLSEFWNKFYNQCTTGNAYKVPFIRHDFGQQQWESVGRIIAFGWSREKYLPVKIAPVILEQAALGYVKSNLVDNFLMPESERAVFESCL